jgi:hypothetical protein
MFLNMKWSDRTARGRKLIGSTISKFSKQAKDWWGEAPELTHSSSKELGVVGSMSQKAEKLPSLGPACGNTHSELAGRRIEPKCNANPLDLSNTTPPARRAHHLKIRKGRSGPQSPKTALSCAGAPPHQTCSFLILAPMRRKPWALLSFHFMV